MQLHHQTHPSSTNEFVTKLTAIHSNAHAALHAAQEAQKWFFDRKKGVPIDYHIGDWVWLKAKT